MSGSPSGLTEFRELWFPSPRIRLPELGPSGPVFIEGGRCISGALGEYTKLWIAAGGRWHFWTPKTIGTASITPMPGRSTPTGSGSPTW